MSEREEVSLAQAFVLHHRPYRNTSLLLECITSEHGRIGLISQGGRRSGHRAMLQPFVPLRLSWVRRGELGRVTGIEPGLHGAGQLSGDALLAGFYLNELLIRLVARGDISEQLFGAYCDSLNQLASGVGIGRVVRLFELLLLESIGYKVELEQDVRTGEPVEAGRSYAFELESGPMLAQPGQESRAYPGEHLISLRQGVLDDSASLGTARRLLGRILDSYVGDRSLRSRDVMHQIAGRRSRQGKARSKEE